MLAVGLEDAAGGKADSITNADAERVLLRVKQKLEGLEGGMIAALLSTSAAAHCVMLFGSCPSVLKTRAVILCARLLNCSGCQSCGAFRPIL